MGGRSISHSGQGSKGAVGEGCVPGETRRGEDHREEGAAARLAVAAGEDDESCGETGGLFSFPRRKKSMNGVGGYLFFEGRVGGYLLLGRLADSDSVEKMGQPI